MRLSRDEAREIACTALLLAVALRVFSGVLQVVQELERDWTVRSALGRFLAPVGRLAARRRGLPQAARL